MQAVRESTGYQACCEIYFTITEEWDKLVFPTAIYSLPYIGIQLRVGEVLYRVFENASHLVQEARSNAQSDNPTNAQAELLG